VKDRYLYMVILPEHFRYRRQCFHYFTACGWYIVLFRIREKLKVISHSSDLGRHGTSTFDYVRFGFYV
jgi:hypothetical protein